MRGYYACQRTERKNWRIKRGGHWVITGIIEKTLKKWRDLDSVQKNGVFGKAGGAPEPGSRTDYKQKGNMTNSWRKSRVDLGPLGFTGTKEKKLSIYREVRLWRSVDVCCHRKQGAPAASKQKSDRLRAVIRENESCMMDAPRDKAFRQVFPIVRT